MVTEKAKKKAEKENIELLELAVNCRLIEPEQEKEILSRLLETEGNLSAVSLSRYLYQEKILEKDQIAFLYAVKKHLDMLMLDKKFGKLGIANDFVSKENVKKALDIQVKIFKERHKSVKIGDILLNNKEITQSDRTAILLTQDRIRDEYLAEALNVIAGDEMERTAINKRFGAIAVKKKLITTDQLNQALKIQKKETAEKGEHRYLGEILREMGGLTEQQTLAVLKIQKKLETRRMNLQKKISAFNEEKESVKTLDQFLELRVSEDKLTAFVIQKTGQVPKTDAAEMINWLSNSGIRFGIRRKEEISGFIDRPEPGKPFLVAQGRAPEPAKNETIKFHVDMAAAKKKEETQNEESAVRVKKDEVIATVTPLEPGKPGKDVFGHPLPVEQEPEVTLSSGKGVTRRGNDFLALIDGRLQIYKNRTLFVLPVSQEGEPRHIDGDVTGEILEEYLNCNLTVSGGIASGASIACNDLMVQGDVKGHITATGDVEISGDVGPDEGDETGADAVRIATSGLLTVNGKRICAQIVTDKGLKAPNTDLVNSKVISSGDVVAKNILSDKDSPTIVRIARKNLVELQKLEKSISRDQQKLNDISRQPELDDLHAKLMKQVQVQNGYLEKQNVLQYLTRILDDPDPGSGEKLAEKIKIYEEKNTALPEKERQETIPEHTKAFVFLSKLLTKIETVALQDQEQYVRQLSDSIQGIYKAAVKSTDRINKKYEALYGQIEKHKQKYHDQIGELEKRISKLLTQRDFLMIESKKAGDDQLLIKVKNEVGQHTVIKGEAAQLVVDKSMYGVFIRERAASADKDAEMVIDGYFG